MPDHQPYTREYTPLMWADTSSNKQIEESSNICQKNHFNIFQLVVGFIFNGKYPQSAKQLQVGDKTI